MTLKAADIWFENDGSSVVWHATDGLINNSRSWTTQPYFMVCNALFMGRASTRQGRLPKPFYGGVEQYLCVECVAVLRNYGLAIDVKAWKEGRHGGWGTDSG